MKKKTSGYLLTDKCTVSNLTFISHHYKIIDILIL